MGNSASSEDESGDFNVEIDMRYNSTIYKSKSHTHKDNYGKKPVHYTSL